MKVSRWLIGALAAVCLAGASSGTANADTSPEQWFPQQVVYGNNLYGFSHLHTLWESSGRVIAGGQICAGAIQDGAPILQERYCSWDLSIQPLNNTSWRQGMISVRNAFSMYARAQIQF